MNEFFANVFNHPMGILGGIFAMLGGGYAIIKRYRRDDKVSDKSAESYNNQLDRLTGLAEAADERAAQAWERVRLADERTDKAYQERNELMLKLGEMTQKISQLTAEVERLNQLVHTLQRQLEAQNAKN